VTSDPAEEFWRFSLDLYGRNGIAELCLSLQDSYDVDVNMVLLCLWNGTLGAAEIGAAEAAAATWRESVIRPLRGVRGWLKSSQIQGAAELRDAVLNAELEAERCAQRLMLAAIGSAGSSPKRGKSAISLYLKAKNLPDQARATAVPALLDALSS
jgi:uncharacterized protein (TIGR02444 family)